MAGAGVANRTTLKYFSEMLKTENYEKNYAQLPFEDILREYRKAKTFEVFDRFRHGKILEIGSGPRPLFADVADFEKMVVIEPGESFFQQAKALASSNPKITMINNLFENVVDDLARESFDIIVIGGFLHEIDNPELFVRSLRKICGKNTVIHSFVPNARSFHRLLAFEMGIIGSVYQKSGNDQLFQRRVVFDTESYREMFTRNGFKVIEAGTYFVKPFTHDQMNKMLSGNVVDGKVMDGLNKMIKYMPDLGAEIFVTCSIND